MYNVIRPKEVKMPRPGRRRHGAPPNPPPPAPGAPPPPSNPPQRKLNWVKVAITAFIIIVLVGGACAYCSTDETPAPPTGPAPLDTKTLTLTREWSEWVEVQFGHKIIWDRVENVQYDADVRGLDEKLVGNYVFPVYTSGTPNTCEKHRRIPVSFHGIRYRLSGSGAETEMRLAYSIVPTTEVGRCNGVKLRNAIPRIDLLHLQPLIF